MPANYVHVENYCMKCRLYPTETQATQIDTLLRGAQAAYNMLLYKIKTEMAYVKEVKDKKGDGVVHFPDFNKAFAKTALDEVRHRNEFVNYVPGEALSSIKYGLAADMKKSWQKSGSLPVEAWSKKNGPKFYSKKCPRTSFSYSTTPSNVHVTANKNVLKIKIGSKNYQVDNLVKIRGWNQRIRFSDDMTMDFADWVTTVAKKVTLRVEKELGRYYIVFSLKDIYKPVNIADERRPHAGIDVGEITLATLSDGNQYDNIYDANPYFEHNTEAIRVLNEQLSRRMGWKNIAFREMRKKNSDLTPSKSYLETEARYKRLSARRADRKDSYYHMVTADICSKYQALAIEGLSVTDMFWRREDAEDGQEKNEQAKSTA